MLYEMYRFSGMENQRVCYTIHNFKHQGVGGADILWATGLNNEAYYFQYARLQDNFNPLAINLMKGGIVYSNHVNTVSPHHAWEARFTPISCGLGHTLELHQQKFGGILNGINYTFWNPETDTYLPANYSTKDMSGKAAAKKDLRARLLLDDTSDRPIIAYIGRLDDQKGVHLVHHAIYYTLHRGGQFVLLGSATEDGINAYFSHEKGYLNDNPNCHLELGFNEELSHLIYAAADIIVVPSNYEPCGLTQVIGLKYGAVPVVRGVGGLVNTVFDWDYEQEKPPEERNGFLFYQTDPYALESAMNRALDLYYDNPGMFAKLQKQGMGCDYSWKKPVEQYTGIYEYIRA